ncbi:MAG: M48 family metallopeptidase [Myxococcota bacterium]|nr:M48 family metallopeptidase [Myxococcota bacterium]
MATDFFELQDDARRNTGRLIALFVLAVIAICFSLYGLAVIVFGYEGRDPYTGDPHFQLLWWNPELLVQVSFATLLVVGGGTLYKLAQLRAGGSFVAESLGGRLVHANSSDPVERKLLNVVEEMAIASGTATPPVYLLEEESGINAFAAGFTIDDAVIGVTRGAVEQLPRDELQGVIAHEFSHILNGDMRLNLRLMGVLHGILLLGIIGYFLLRSSMFAGGGRRSGRDNSGTALVVVGGGLMLIGFVGTLFGNLIKASVSRQREFLADASSVQFTRNPGGIAGALKRIGGAAEGSEVQNPAAPEASHMFFGRATSGFNALFSTHPPLAERIERLDPSWSGSLVAEATAEGGQSHLASGFAGAAEAGPTGIEHIGQPSLQHLEYANTILTAIPESLRDAAHDAYGARALVYALLLQPDAEIRSAQLDALARHADPGVFRETQQLLSRVDALDPVLRLPLVDTSLPALRELSPTQYEAFCRNLQALVEADARLDLFEWTLQRLLVQHLRPAFAPSPPQRVRYRSLRPLENACRVLLSALAHAGRGSPEEMQRAFALGAQRLQLPPQGLLPPEDAGLAQIDRSLDRIAAAAPKLKRAIVYAAADCIQADERITSVEADLMRAIADSLGCPMPPLLPGQSLVASA